MTTLSIAVTAPMRRFVEEQAAREGFPSVDAYFQSLIQNAQRREAQSQLEARLLEGLNSGPATEMTADDWDYIRQEVRKHTAVDTA